MPDGINRKVIVAGVGYSETGRNLPDRSEGSLAFEACMNAMAEAGVTNDDVDGMVTWPDRRGTDPFDGPDIKYMQNVLGLKNLRWWHATGFGTGEAQLGGIMAATYVMSMGAASVVVTYRAHKQMTLWRPNDDRPQPVVGGNGAFSAPYGSGGPSGFALRARRQMHEYGLTEEHLGAVCVNCSYHASLNPRAVTHKDHAITMDEYMDSRMVATPFHIFDCDMPIDGAVALVLMTADRAADQPNKPVYIEALGHAGPPNADDGQWPDLTECNSRWAAANMWSNTALKQSDVDVAECYDGFSWLTLCWLEDAGFFKKGEAGPYMLEGKGRFDSGSGMPISTDGGMLGIGRLHGYTKIAAATLQLQEKAGPYQVNPSPNVAFASTGGGNVGSCMLLTT